MSKNLFIRKEFNIEKSQYDKIWNYLFNGDDLDEEGVLAEFIYEVEDFKIVLQMNPVGYAVIDLACKLYSKKDNDLIYAISYTIDELDKMYNVFMLDTKNTETKVKTNKYKDVEFYFTFSYEKTSGSSLIYLKNHTLPQMDKPITNLFAIMKYSSLHEKELFPLLVEFVYSINEIEYLLKEKTDTFYLLCQLEYLKEKLSVAGYDQHYLANNYSTMKVTMTNDKILNHLLIITLDYLYLRKTKLVPNNSELSYLTKMYCDNLSKAI